MTTQVTYSNHFTFNGRELAFKSKNLWDITVIPALINLTDKGWYINRSLLTMSKAKELVIMQENSIDISELQWFIQEQIIAGIFWQKN